VAPQIRQRSSVDVWRRIGTMGLIVAGILILTAVLFPSPTDPADYSSFLAVLVEDMTRTRLVMITVPVGIWALAAGIAAIYHSEEDGAASVGLRLGFYGVLAGATVVTVQFALGSAALAESSRGAFDLGETLWAGATYVRSFGMLVLWAGLASVGWGMLGNRRFAKWLGWPPIVLGVAMIAVSSATIVVGPTKGMTLASGGLAGLTAIWSVVLGVRSTHSQLKST